MLEGTAEGTQKLEELRNKEQPQRPALSGVDYARAQESLFHARTSRTTVATYMTLILSATRSTATRASDYIYTSPTVTICLKLTELGFTADNLLKIPSKWSVVRELLIHNVGTLATRKSASRTGELLNA